MIFRTWTRGALAAFTAIFLLSGTYLPAQDDDEADDETKVETQDDQDNGRGDRAKKKRDKGERKKRGEEAGDQERRGPRGDRGDRGDFRGGDPAERMNRMARMFQERLGISEEDWEVIEPLLSDVMTKQRETRGGGRMFGGRRGGGDEEEEEANPASELRNIVSSDSATPEDIKAALDAYRKDRDAKIEDLKKSQEKLREVLTLKQEAQLVLFGFLD